jgi:hypothetical protein
MLSDSGLIDNFNELPVTVTLAVTETNEIMLID